MRLDHLLSKEHAQSSSVYRDFKYCQAVSDLFGFGSAHGWNIDIVARDETWDLVRQLRLIGTVLDGFAGLLHAVGS